MIAKRGGKLRSQKRTKEGAPDPTTPLSTQAESQCGSRVWRKPTLPGLKGNRERNATSSVAVSLLLSSGIGDFLRWNILLQGRS